MNDPISDTLYIPLAARIYSTEHFPEYFRDDASAELKNRIPAGVTGGSSEYTYIASVARYYNSDRLVRDFVHRNGRSSIVFLGAGLETAYLRLSGIDAHFYDLDLPDVIDARRELLPHPDNETAIAGDLFDMRWADSVDKSVPVMILALGVFQYFHEDEITDLIERMKGAFPSAELVFDATTTKGLEYTNRYVRRTGNLSAAMYFAVDDADKFAEMTHTGLIDCIPFFTDARRMLKGKIGLYSRIAMRVTDRGMRAKILHLRL